VENVISDLAREHKHDFHIVRLNGFIHTDDKLALREIWRQLGKEMNVEDDLMNRVSRDVRPGTSFEQRLMISDQLRRHNGVAVSAALAPL
jgi:hypothetical protein